jgi:hypothetical protein
MGTPTVPFSDLSKHSKQVAEKIDRFHRVHVKRRDGEDLYVSTARHDRQRDEVAYVSGRLIAELLATGEGAATVLGILPKVFPWARHLSEDERRQFLDELVEATSDAVELDVPATLHRVIVEWRATARILADPALTAELTRPLPEEDHGEVPAP